MKKLLFLYVVFLTFPLWSQDKNVNLTIWVNSDEAFENITFKNFIGSISYVVNDGSEISFENPIPEEYVITAKTQAGLKKGRVWLDEGTIEVLIQLQDGNLTVEATGSEIFDKVQSYKKKFKELREAQASAQEFNRFFFEQLQANKENPFSIFISLDMALRNSDNKEVLSLLLNEAKDFPDAVKNHYTATLLWDTLDNYLNTGSIDLADFSFLDEHDQVQQVTWEENTYVLLDFWNTACPPCIKDHQNIKGILSDFTQQKTKVISISNDRDERIETWKKYVGSKKLPWAQYVEPPIKGLSQHLNLSVFPTYILLDKEMNVVLYTNSLNLVKKELKI